MFRRKSKYYHYCEQVKNGGLEVDMRGKNLSKEGAEQIAQALMDPNSKVQRLGLRNNKISYDGATAIAEALKFNSTLQLLFLDDNKVGDDGATAIAKALNKSTLQELYLSNNNIKISGVKAISQALKTNSTLKVLYLCNNNTGKDGAKAIAEALKVNSTLQELFLDNNNIGDEGATVIADALEINSTLTELSVDNNNISNPGATAMATALARNTNSKLRALWYLNNNISEHECDNIERSLSRENQSISANPVVQDMRVIQEDSTIVKARMILDVVVVVVSFAFVLWWTSGQAVQKDLKLVTGSWNAFVNRVVPVTRAAAFHRALEWSWSTPLYPTWPANSSWKVTLLVLITHTAVFCYCFYKCFKMLQCIMDRQLQTNDLIINRTKAILAALTVLLRGDTKPCPRLIWIEYDIPKNQRGMIEKVKRLLKGTVAKEVAVYFVCERSRSLGHEDPIIIDVPREWVKNLLPLMKLALLAVKVASALGYTPLSVPTGENFFTTLVNDFLGEHQDHIIETLESMEQMLDDFNGAPVEQDARYVSFNQLLDDAYRRFSVLALEPKNKKKWIDYMSPQFVDREWKWVKNNADPGR
jgi:Ran GTPase-activating protein (RanGAP) involved in mRNA processing and transport